MKKRKLQIKSKARGPKQPKWVPPEDRMKKYGDFGVTLKNPSVEKVKWTKFCIVVPTAEDKKELQAAFEYFHDNPLIDTDFVTVNQLAHLYLDEPASPVQIIVDEDTFRKMEQEMCQHKDTYVENGIKYCKKCWKALEVTSYSGL